MDDLIKILLIIVLFYFLLQIISKFCFPPNNKPSLIEGLCSDPDGIAVPDISVEGDCIDPNVWSGCYDPNNNLTAATNAETCGICSNNYTDGSSPPNQQLCESGDGSDRTSTCKAPTGTTDETVIAAAEALDTENECVGEAGSETGNTWGPSPGRWTPYEWRVGGTGTPDPGTSDPGTSDPGTSDPGTSAPEPATGGTCSDSRYTNEQDCIGSDSSNPNGVCNNYDPSGQSSVTTETVCTDNDSPLFSDSGSCPSGGITNETVPRYSQDLTTETECNSAVTIDASTPFPSPAWIPPTTRATWTVNTWTPNTDCVGSWSQCGPFDANTGDCGVSRYTITTPQSGNGIGCEANTEDTRACNFGEGECVSPDTEQLHEIQTQGSDPTTYEPQTLSNMTFNVVIQPSQPTQPCQPDQTNCSVTTTGPLQSCLIDSDCIDQNAQCINRICIN